jgi:hypothetical protein
MTVSYMIDDYHLFEGKVYILYSCFYTDYRYGEIDYRYGEWAVSDATFSPRKQGWLWGTTKKAIWQIWYANSDKSKT